MRFLFNTVGESAPLLWTANNAGSSLGENPTANVLRGGPRHLYYNAGGGRFYYVRKQSPLPFVGIDHLVVTRIDRLIGMDLRWGYFTNYNTIGLIQGLSPIVPVGARSQDLVREIAPPDSEAFSFENRTAGTYKYSQVFFSKALELLGVESFSSRVDIGKIVIHRQCYFIEETATLVITRVTRDQLRTLENSNLREPFFLYDRTAKILLETLWHCIITSCQVLSVHNDFHTVRFDIARLRSYA